MTTHIYVKTQFAGFHRWAEAPSDVEFLRTWHRHNFHVKVTLGVSHNDRQVEFFMFKKELDAYITETFSDAHFEYSCESIAYMILLTFTRVRYHVVSVEVNEDGDNGAIVFSS